MAKIGDEPFTIIHIEDSDYESGGEVTKGVKIKTEETFDVDGTPYQEFHTTRVAVVSRLKNEKIREDINSGKEKLFVKCITEQTKAGKDFYNLVDG